MLVLDPNFNTVAIAGYRVTNFAEGASFDYSSDDGFDAKVGVGGTVGAIRVHNPLGMLNLHIMQGSPDALALSGILEGIMAAGVPVPVLISDARRPGQTLAGMAIPQKRPDDPGLGTSVGQLSYPFHVQITTNTQGAVLPPFATP